MACVAVLALFITGCTGGPPEDATGDEIYVQVCARCHGPALEGRVGPALGADSDAATRTDEALIETVTDGRGSMPSFRQTLSAQQIERVVDYLRFVQAGS